MTQTKSDPPKKPEQTVITKDEYEAQQLATHLLGGRGQRDKTASDKAITHSTADSQPAGRAARKRDSKLCQKCEKPLVKKRTKIATLGHKAEEDINYDSAARTSWPNISWYSAKEGRDPKLANLFTLCGTKEKFLIKRSPP